MYVKNLNLIVETADNRKKFRLDFEYEGNSYSRFSVGDITVRKMYEDKPAGKYKFCNKAIIVFSLMDKFLDNRYYKMATQFIVWK